MLNLVSILDQRKHRNAVLRSAFGESQGNNEELDQRLEDYAGLVTGITSQCYTVSVETLNRTFYTEPEWYDEECKKKLTNIKVHANLWIDSVKPKLLSVPETIVSYNSLYRYYSAKIREIAQILIQDPEDKNLNDAILDFIGKLRDGAQNQKNLIDDTVQEIQGLLEHFKNDKTAAQDVQKKALSEKEVNENRVKEYTKNVKDFKDEIEKYQKRVMAEEIALGVSITVCGIGIAGAVAGQFWMVFVAIAGGAGIIASIVLMVEDNKKIAEIGEKLIEENAKLSHAEMDAVEFGKLADSTKRICDALETALTALTDIGSLWGGLQENAKELMENIEVLDSDAKTKLFEDLLSEMENTDDRWKKLVEKAQKMNLLDIQVDKTKSFKMTMEDGKVRIA